MKSDELDKRVKTFALRIIKFVVSLPKNEITYVLGHQLLKSGTSIGANYREAKSAQSRDDFIHKIGLVEKETNETRYWLELFEASNTGNLEELKSLIQEVSELLAIFIKSGKTAKINHPKRHYAIKES